VIIVQSSVKHTRHFLVIDHYKLNYFPFSFNLWLQNAFTIQIPSVHLGNVDFLNFSPLGYTKTSIPSPLLLTILLFIIDLLSRLLFCIVQLMGEFRIKIRFRSDEWALNHRCTKFIWPFLEYADVLWCQLGASNSAEI